MSISLFLKPNTQITKLNYKARLYLLNAFLTVIPHIVI